MVCRQFSIALISYLNPILCTSLLILTEVSFPATCLIELWMIWLLIIWFNVLFIMTQIQYDVSINSLMYENMGLPPTSAFSELY